jgi:predicted AAA+ superfamily ATPase
MLDGGAPHFQSLRREGSQDEYLDMVFGYAAHLGLVCDEESLRRDALEWATTRGARSGRTAWQFIQDLAGRLGKRIDGGG